MFSNHRDIHKNGSQPRNNSNSLVYHSPRSNHLPNPNQTKGRMEPNLIFTVLSAIGAGSYISAILLNMGTWKSDLLALFGFAFILLKFIRLTIKTWQDYRKEELQIKVMRKKSEKV